MHSQGNRKCIYKNICHVQTMLNGSVFSTFQNIHYDTFSDQCYAGEPLFRVWSKWSGRTLFSGSTVILRKRLWRLTANKRFKIIITIEQFGYSSKCEGLNVVTLFYVGRNNFMLIFRNVELCMSYFWYCILNLGTCLRSLRLSLLAFETYTFEALENLFKYIYIYNKLLRI